MTGDDIINTAVLFTESSAYNRIQADAAISDSVAGMRIFDQPLFAFGNAADEYYTLLKKPSAAGEFFLTPDEWLDGAKTVISFFLPFTDTIRTGNRKDKSWPSDGWLHGRVEGQNFINKLALHIKSAIESEGYTSLIPVQDSRFRFEASDDENGGLRYTSSWSERHAAYICGMGSFGLSKNLITVKGSAGRLGSVITTLGLTHDTRNYNDIYDYCTMCGACIRNCPVDAISIEHGKNHKICSAFQDMTAEKFRPRYGCGKCQVGVPCENRIPLKKPGSGN